MHFSVGDVVYLISYPSHRMTVVESRSELFMSFDKALRSCGS